ncbi:alpha/beta-hydrolase [Gonapodya prolifera JEL478]|uniref:Alpha/beta-hydrolase n=1 Tax=Gonapodya prolifera (strain JEL478) TaxID=1344416 RepID=A0A139A5A7_GONPJ|nr:alpha/beta-hydrolase [Gonapodya prolifera JEL478]|eukprot:KXS11997.1 alpha/beta-hydrolase [Gonapodya prolifera JEL478]
MTLDTSLTSADCCRVPASPNFKPTSEYVPVGKTLHNVDGYGFDLYVTPESAPKGKAAIIGIYDVFGVHPNPRQVADNLAKATGVTVIFPDVFHGNPWDIRDFPPKDGFEALIKHVTNQAPWEVVGKDIKNTIQWAKTNLGAEKFGIVGFCWGAKQAVKASAEFGNSELVGGALFHQSFTEPSDAETVQMPLCLLPSQGEPDLTEYFGVLKKRFGDVVVHQRFDDMPHGWCGASADFSNPVNRQRTEEAVTVAARFFAQVLPGANKL